MIIDPYNQRQKDRAKYRRYKWPLT